MVGNVVEWYLHKIENERRIKLPYCLFNQEGLKELDKVVSSKNALKVSLFYANYFDKYFNNPELLKIISTALKKERVVSEDDNKLINFLVKIKNKDPESFFEFIGNIYYITNLMQELCNSKGLTKNIHISLILWSYLNAVELTARYISGLLREYIKENNIKKYDWFIDKFTEGEHPTIGNIINCLEGLELLKNPKNSIFSTNRIIRNKVSHANIYYDSNIDRIYMSNGKEYSTDDLQKELQGLYEFLLELLYQFNKSNTNLINSIKRILLGLSSTFLKIERSGTLRKQYKNYIFEWEK